jgi:hypothetical protein
VKIKKKKLKKKKKKKKKKKTKKRKRLNKKKKKTWCLNTKIPNDDPFKPKIKNKKEEEKLEHQIVYLKPT